MSTACIPSTLYTVYSLYWICLPMTLANALLEVTPLYLETMKVEPEYLTPLKEVPVQFDPVPLFYINIHDPLKQDLYISATIASQQEPWDQYIWNMMVHIFQNDPTRQGLFVDVGANLGYFSLMAASMGHPVIAFEPMNRNVLKFHASIRRNLFEEKITLYHQAVSSASKQKVSLKHTHSTNQGNGQISTSPSKSFVFDEVYGIDYVTTVTLSEVIQSPVLLVKIDVEGHECHVLKGMLELMEHYNVRFIILEVSEATKRNPTCNIEDVLFYLQHLKYVFSDVIPNSPPLSLDQIVRFPPNILCFKL